MIFKVFIKNYVKIVLECKYKLNNLIMITEDFVSYEIAKLLKEKGFEILTDKVYDNQNKLDYQNIVCCQEKRLPYISAPTLQMAMKW